MAINWFIIPPDDAELVYTRHGRYVAVVINQKGMKHRRPQLNGAWMDGWMDADQCINAPSNRTGDYKVFVIHLCDCPERLI